MPLSLPPDLDNPLAIRLYRQDRSAFYDAHRVDADDDTDSKTDLTFGVTVSSTSTLYRLNERH